MFLLVKIFFINIDKKLFFSAHIFKNFFFLTCVETNYFFQFFLAPPQLSNGTSLTVRGSSVLLILCSTLSTFKHALLLSVPLKQQIASALTLSILNLHLSSSSTTSRELLSQFATCSGWKWFEVGEKLKKIVMYWYDSFIKIIIIKPPVVGKLGLFSGM